MLLGLLAVSAMAVYVAFFSSTETDIPTKLILLLPFCICWFIVLRGWRKARRSGRVA